MKKLWLIWKNPETRRRYKIGILNYENGKYSFKYVNPELDDAIQNSFKCFPGFEDVNKEYVSGELFPNIVTRLPNPSRPDYLDILNAYGLEGNSTIMDILVATRGRLITDNYEFVLPFDEQKIEFDIAGISHSKDIKKIIKDIIINDRLELEKEPNNKFDNNAIKIMINKNGKKYHIGYVPRYYASDLSKLLDKNISYSALVKNINFKSAINDDNITVFVKLIFNK